MKHLLQYLSILLLVLFVSCAPVEEGLEQTEILRLSTNEMEIDASGGEEILTINSLCDWYTSNAEGSWVNLSSTTGLAGTTDVLLTFSENQTPENRYATIEVWNSRYNISQLVEIHQEASEPFIFLNKSKQEVDANGETIELVVDSNIDYIITSSASWIRKSISSGSAGTKNISIIVDKSYQIESSRSATITFSNEEYDISTTFTITQKKATPSLGITTNSIFAPSEGKIISENINSNISWKASCNADWVTLTPASSDKGKSTLKIEIAANPTTAARQAIITISNTEHNIEKKINITQEALMPTFGITTNSISAPIEGTTNLITINSNISWKASCDAEWVSFLTPANGDKGTSYLQIKVAANPRTAVRQAIVTISNAEYNIEKQITISQSAVKYENQIITYTSSTNEVVTPYNADSFGNVKIIANDYVDGTGIIIFNTAIGRVGAEAFSNCKTLTSITIPNRISVIGEKAFSGCTALKNITIPESVTQIGANAFAGCASLTDVTIPEGVTQIGHYAFSDCTALKNITIPESVTFIGNYAFYICRNLTSIAITSKVTSIGIGTFSYCTSLTDVTIPEGVLSIGEKAFSQCSKLTKVTIPKSVNSIGYSAFDGCTRLGSVYCKPTTPPNGANKMFITSGCKIYVPKASVAAYKAAYYWHDYSIEGYDF